jgi:putative addiction module CopG family antidote
MVDRNISLPEATSQFIDEQVAAGRYPSPSEFVTDLIEQARTGIAPDRLTALIREGMESGDGEEVNDAWWSRLDEKVQAELQRRQSA